MSSTHALRVGDVVRQGRIVALQEATANLRGYAWVQRKCPDGTIEREMFWLEELASQSNGTEPRR